MDSLPKELPYKMEFELEYLGTSDDDSICCVVIARAETVRTAKLALGKGGERVKMVARQAEEQLSNALRTTVRLKISVQSKDQNK